MHATNKRWFSIVLLLPLLLIVSMARAQTTYVVQPGDSLFRIAVQYGTTVDALVQANNIVNPSLIFVGQELIIPDGSAPVAGQPGTGQPAATPAAPAPGGATGGSPVQGGVVYTVQPGDSLFRISLRFNVPVAEIAAANNLANASLIIAGQELFIPGATAADSGTTPPVTAAATPVPPPAATTAPPPAVASGNLFRNGNFEGDWYFYLYNELQVPEGWQLATDEGPNTLEGGPGGLFNRPEVRVVGRNQLPENEWSSFIFDGDKTVKAFKGSAPTAFSLFQDVSLQPGRYRLTLNFFPDIVAHYYPGGARDWNFNPLAGEVRVIHNNGGTGWTPVVAGQKNTVTYEFNVDQTSGQRLGASFRNRLATANNGWFLDDWRLEKID